MDTVQQIKDKLSIVDVIAPYVKLTRAGASFKARCPFHSERTPSFVVSPSRGTYHCFGCGAGGDHFSFIQEIEGLDFKGALKILAERAGVEISYERGTDKSEKDDLFAICEKANVFFEKQFASNTQAQEYLLGRGLTKETIQSFRIGWAPNDWRMLTTHLKDEGFSEAQIEKAGLGKKTEKGMYDRFRSRIIFPIFDSAGRVVAFSGRYFLPKGQAPAEGQEPPKYLNSPETPLFHKSRILYGYDRAKLAIRKFNCTVLVEGQMDLVMSHQAHWSNAVAVSGTALTPEHVALIHRLSDNLVIALDADEAGIRAAAKSARIALSSGMDVKVAALPEGQDPADLIKEGGKDAWGAVMRDAKHVIIYLMDILEQSQKDSRAFARAVERSVVPFVAAIKSSIDREHFIHEVAGRINVPETAIRDAIKAMPKEPSERVAEEHVTTPAPKAEGEIAPRMRQLAGVLLWQQALKNPTVDLDAFTKEAHKAADTKELIPETLSEEEKEALRFAAEGLYGDSEHLENETGALLRAVELERLRQALRGATLALRQAEAKGDERAVEDALKQCQLYTAAIANVTKVR